MQEILHVTKSSLNTHLFLLNINHCGEKGLGQGTIFL